VAVYGHCRWTAPCIRTLQVPLKTIEAIQRCPRIPPRSRGGFGGEQRTNQEERIQHMVVAGQGIVDCVAAASRRHAGNTAFTALGADRDYARLERLSTAFAHWLVQAQGLQPGERVALQLPNLLQYPVAALGVLKAGGVIVNVNPLYTAPELEHQLRDSGARVLLVSANTAHVAARIVASTSIARVVVTELGDLHPWPKRALLNFVVRHVKKLVPPFTF